MWSNLDKLTGNFMLKLEQALGEMDPDLKAKLPLDELEVTMDLNQLADPAILNWSISVLEQGVETYSISHSTELPS